MMQNMLPNTHLLGMKINSTTFLYCDDVNIMANLVNMMFSLGTYIMNRVLVLNM